MLGFSRTVVVLVMGASVASCVSTESPILEGGEECEEFVPGEPVPAGLEVRDEVRTFMEAAADLTGVGGEMGQEVLEACAGIATDLGAEDSWSHLEGLDQQIANADETGACDAASARILDRLADAKEVDATVALLVTRGECHVDFEAQAACDQQCALDATCDPGTVETRCEPGELSVECHAECEAEATCAGTADHPANCMGECESECVGSCSGTCIAADGSRTENDPSCVGKCTSSCNGECRGRCTLEQPIECGAEVSCEGGCTATYDDPVCTDVCTPPVCHEDPECHAACEAQALASAVCEPTRVELFADVASNPTLQPLVDSLEEHLPALFDAAESRGPLVRHSLERLGDSGKAIAADLGDLSGVELSCTGDAVNALVTTFGVFDVAIDASVDLTVTTSNACE
jgi:hypothetical protein